MEAQLSLGFHGYTAVALHDWQTYNEMAALAHMTYGLNIQPPRLPGTRLDQGASHLHFSVYYSMLKH